MADERVQWGRVDTRAVRLLILPLAGVLTIAGAGAGCKDDDEAGGSVSVPGEWKELDPGTLDAAGGFAVAPSGRGAPGGNIDVVVAGPLSFGATLGVPADVPPAPAGAMKITSLDADVTVAGPAVIGDLAVGGDGPRRVTVTGGDLFVTGTLRAADAAGAGRALTIEARDGTIYVPGTIETRGKDGSGLAGAALSLTAGRVVVTGTLSTAGGDGGPMGGPAGELRISSTGDVLLIGMVRARGGAAPDTSGDAQGGAAATLTIDAAGNVQLGGAVDLRGGPARGGAMGLNVAAGAGGHIAIGAMVAPASVTFALDVSLDGGEGQSAAGSGGNLTAKTGGTFTLAGHVRANGGSIAAGGSGDGGLAGNFKLDIVTTVGDQIYHPGSGITLDGGESGGMGVAGGGGHLYALSYDGNVTMSGTLNARGGTARDPGGSGGLGGHVNIFSDANHDGVGGNLTIMPDGVIDVSGGAGTIGGHARNDGTYDVATFPDGQEMIAVLLNADGIHGTPENGIIDNQGVVIARGGGGNGNGGDIAFHGEGTGGLHDPLGGRLEMDADGTGSAGQFASE